MKTRTVLVCLAASLLSYGAFAQAIENDDMYFSAKDRAKLKALRGAEVTASAKEVKRQTSREEEQYINPTDSYSARSINPEFAARSQAEIAQSDNEDYFVNDYKYNTANNLNNWNNNFNSWYGNSWYRPNYYGSSINSWNSPYYGYNDPYMSPWGNPYWNNNSWSASFGYHWGNSWNYGWGGNYNYYDPYYGGGWGPGWGSYSSYGYGYGGYGYYYPRTIVVVERNAPAYGKRTSRSNSTINREHNSPANNNLNRGNLTTGRQAGGSYVNTSNRTSSQQDVRPAQQEYYNRAWRRVTQTTTTDDSNSAGRSNSNNSFFNNNSNNNSNSNWNNGNSSRSSYSGGNSPSRSSGSSSGGSRSSGSSSGGSSGSRSSRSH